ncbi:uncharacterized protein LOC113316221 [Papaver somniferum]|uniref:uncharacterized protein LOC113316221 n=1 Tax=Papaver somniferum TaxID=3469 RepID=UPI000E6F68A5|nr:uncharacterized protein LOC113316221 [Papaver somniferum]
MKREKGRKNLMYWCSIDGWSFFQKRVFNLIHEYSARMNGSMFNTGEDLRIVEFFRVKTRRVHFVDPVGCFWSPPGQNEILLCCDGALTGNPVVAGAGVVARDATCTVVGAMSIWLEVASNYLAEIYAILVGLEWAIVWGFRNVVVRTDSLSAIRAFEDNSVPWFFVQRWMDARRKYDYVRFIHTYREANFTADNMAKRGCFLTNGMGMHYVGRPIFLKFC